MDLLGLKDHATIYNEIEGFGVIEDDIVQKNIKLRKENATIEIRKISKSDILRSFNEITGNLSFIEEDIDECIIENDEAFIYTQHEFLNGGYIAINIKDNILNVVTYTKKAYIIDMEKVSKKVYGVLFTSFVPRKICFDTRRLYKSPYTIDLKINNPYDISHIIKMFFNQNVSSLYELVEMFTKTICSNENKLLYNTFQIKNKLNNVLESYSLMSLLNKEMSIISVVSKLDKTGIPFSKELFDEFQSQLCESYNAAIELVEKNIGSDIRPYLNNKDELLSLLHNKELFATFNKDFWEAKNNTDMQGLTIAHNLINKYNNAEFTIKEDRIFLGYNIYNDYGNVSSNFTLDNRYIVAKEGKMIVTGTYPDLYFRIFASLSNIDYLINAVNNNTFVEDLTLNTFQKDNPTSRFLAKNILRAYIEGYMEHQDLVDYFFNKLDTKFNTMEKFQKIFNSNSSQIINFIEQFYKDQSIDKRLCFTQESLLHQYIKMTEADIFKAAILLINETINNFNESNKYKINLIGVQNESIILETDEQAVNIAVDTLNRKLTQAFDTYIRKVKAVCNVVAASSLRI